MTTTGLAALRQDIDYPTADGQPMAETEWHLWNMIWLVQALSNWFADEQQSYVGANMFLYYVEGNRNRHVAPDVFVVRGVPKRRRAYYLLWEEGRPPDVVIELTSRSTREEDEKDKFRIYRDEVGVREYFLFDPHMEYLDPPLKGFRLRDGQYEPIEAVDGRLPSERLGLHLERSDWILRLWDPGTGLWLPLPEEEIEQAKAGQRQIAVALEQAEAARRQAEAEADRLRHELDELRRGRSGEEQGKSNPS